MSAARILILVVTVAIVVAVGSALAATHAAGDSAPRPPAPAGAETPPAASVQESVIPGGGTGVGPSEATRAIPVKAITSPVTGSPAAQHTGQNARDCPDDCGDGGAGVHAASRGSVPAGDDDGDGDGGDCGEGD